MLRAIVLDFRLAWRGWRHQPGITAAIVASLALGIGTATGMFAVVHAVLLAPLPYEQPDRLVTIWSRWGATERTWVSSADVRDVRTQSRLAADAAIWTWSRVTLTGMGDAASLNAGSVTPNTFAVLGVSPLHGRVFTDAEALAATKSGRPMVAVLGYNLWRGVFAGDTAVVGRAITINGHPVTVLGVMPPRFRLPTDFTRGAAAPTELWTPLYNDPSMNERGLSYYGAARLAGNGSLAAFNDELRGFAADFIRSGRYRATSNFTLFAQRIDDDVFGGIRTPLRLLTAGVLLVLLIACGNASALLLARAETRRREWATRVALGASRWLVFRSQLIEGALLSAAGGTVGIVLALGATKLIGLIGPTAIPRASEVALDWRVVSFMFALAAGATIVSSLAPALSAVRVNLVEGIKDGSQNASAGRGRLRLRALLVASQLAFGMLLLTSAGLLGRTLLAMRQVDLGFEPAHVLTARLELPDDRYTTVAQVDAYMSDLTARLRQLPGVKSAGIVRSLPLAQTIGYWPITVEGYTAPTGVETTADWQIATPGVVEALGERLVRGRLFADSDSGSAPVAVVINEAMARQYWPGLDPVGRRVRFSNDAPLVWGTVVGIVGNVRHNGLLSQVKPKFYLPYAQFVAATGDDPMTVGSVVLRAEGDPLSYAVALRSAALAVDRAVPLSAVRPMTDVVDTALTSPRLMSSVMTSFAMIALLLSALGLFSLLVYLVGQRTQEFGIRMALGANRAEVVRLVIAHGSRVAGLGVAAGLLLSVFAVRAMSSLLYGVAPWDPVTWIAAPSLLLMMAVFASLVPALRAASINPLRALRRS